MQDISQEESSTSDPSLISSQVTSTDLRSAIFSQGSAAGAMRCDEQAGPMTDLFGQALAPASRSPAQARWNGSLTSGTFGRLGFGSSRSERLQQSLENRLRARLNGSDLCEVIWTRWDTPWGARRSRPRARVRTTCETGSGLWPTIRANKWGPPDSHGNMAMWHTPTSAGNQAYPSMAKHAGSVAASVWPTPTATNRDEETLAKCATFRKRNAGQNTVPLYLAETANGSSAQTEKRGALNPAFVCWLMGYPTAWVNCADLATPSTRVRRRRS